MGSTCLRNLTVHVGGNTFWSCTTLAGRAPPEYLDSHECIPDALMMPAWVVDRINERSLIDIPGTCIQLSVIHGDYSYMTQEDFTLDVMEATRRAPTKHAIVSSIDGDNTYYLATAAKMFNLPVIDGNWLAGDAIRHADEINFPTLVRRPAAQSLPPPPCLAGASHRPAPSHAVLRQYRTISDVRAAIPGLLNLLPDTFAFLTDDGPNSASQYAEVLALVSQSGKTIAFSTTIPEYQAARPQVTMGPMEDFVNRLRAETIRHVLVAAGSFVQPYLACAIHRAGIDPKLVQVVVVGGAVVEISRSVVVDPLANGNVTTNDYSVVGDSYCTTQEVYAVAENGGWIGMQPCTASTYAEDDVLVNRVLRDAGIPAGLSPGARAMDGSNWTAEQTLTVAPTSTCADNDAAVNEATLLRRLANMEGTITCADVLPFGQSLRYSMINIIAELCPISMCAYNKYSAACRISCACTDSSLNTTTGAPLCTTFHNLPRGYNIISPFALKEFRCDGEDCRTLPYFTSPLAFWNMGMEYTFGNQSGADNYASAQFGRYGQYTLGYLGRGGPSKYIGMTLVDAVWGLGLTYRCGYDRHGAQWLDRLANWQYDDQELWEQMRECLTDPTAVQYPGTHGHINFAFYRSPSPGFTVNTLNQPALSEGRGVHTCGQIVPGVGEIVSSVNVLKLARAARLAPSLPWISSQLMSGDDAHDPLPTMCVSFSAQRVFGRDDHTQCPDITGDFSPLQICPAGTSLEQTEYDTTESLAAKMPLSKASVCAPGQYPISEFETSLGRADSCIDCPAGTYKPDSSSDRCAPCELGFLCPEQGATVRENCPSNTFSDTSTALQLEGVPSALHSQAWTQARAGFTECLACPANSVTEELGSSRCKCMRDHYLQDGICTICPSGMVTTFLATIEPDMTAIDHCVCKKGEYANGQGGCEACPTLRTTDAAGATSSDDCVVEVWAVGTIVGCTLGALVILLVIFFMYRRTKRLEEEQLEARKELVASAMQDTAEFAYPSTHCASGRPRLRLYP